MAARASIKTLLTVAPGDSPLCPDGREVDDDQVDRILAMVGSVYSPKLGKKAVDAADVGAYLGNELEERLVRFELRQRTAAVERPAPMTKPAVEPAPEPAPAPQ